MTADCCMKLIQDVLDELRISTLIHDEMSADEECGELEVVEACCIDIE
jgi:hypothetical protein